MGGKGAQPQNSQMVNFEMEQAAKADQKEKDRQSRLDQGMANIKNVFQGSDGTDPFAATKENYKTNLTSLHDANLNQTYNKSLDEALFATARAGQRGSTTARDIMADIGGRRYEQQPDGTYQAIDYGQYGQAKNKISGEIDKSLGDLNTQIQSAQDASEKQLYMTEDPGQAQTEASKLAGQIPTVPQYNSLGDLFKPLVVGATGFYGAYQGQKDFNQAFAGNNPLGKGTIKTSQG